MDTFEKFKFKRLPLLVLMWVSVFLGLASFSASIVLFIYAHTLTAGILIGVAILFICAAYCAFLILKRQYDENDNGEKRPYFQDRKSDFLINFIIVSVLGLAIGVMSAAIIAGSWILTLLSLPFSITAITIFIVKTFLFRNQ